MKTKPSAPADIPEEEPAKSVEHAFEFKPIEYHEWHQEGNMIICTSCVHNHSAHIAPNLILGKDSEGKFTLRTIEEDAKARAMS